MDLSTFAHFDEALKGNPLAGPVLLGENSLNSVVTQVEAVLAGAAGVARDDHRYTGIFSEAAFVAIARALRRGNLDLADSTALADLLAESVDLANAALAASGSTVRVNADRLNASAADIAQVHSAAGRVRPADSGHRPGRVFPRDRSHGL